MNFLQKYQNKKIAIYGMGLTGISVANVLKKFDIKIYCWDDNAEIRKKAKKHNYHVDKFWFNKNLIDKIVVSPGIDISNCRIKNYLKKNSKKIITDLDIFFEFNKNSLIISVTGTNGKSTTCKIVEKILKHAGYNVKTVGNIGKPILNLNSIKKKYTYIIEASSYQLEYSKLFRSHHAVILNISPDHLERHKNMKNYTNIKSKIFFAQKKTDYLYINSKNKYSKFIKKNFIRKNIKSNLVEINNKSYNFLLKQINNKYFSNNGNIENLIFAYKIAKNLKISDKKIVNAVNNFKGLPHRQEVVFSNKKILCINDSKATSFDASLQSLSSYNKIYWILGGLPKYKDIFNMKNVKKNIIKAYIIGKHIAFFKKQIKNDVLFTVSKDIRNALINIFKDLKTNKENKATILFSPAAASFDQFDNFEKRGIYFRKLLEKTIQLKKNV